MALKPIHKVKAGSLHFQNLDKTPPEDIRDESDVTVTNAHEPGLLIDPENSEAENLHFSNLQKEPNTKRKLGAKVKAKAKTKPAKVKADFGFVVPVEEEDQGEDDEADDRESTNVGAIPNSRNPAGLFDNDEPDTTVSNGGNMNAGAEEDEEDEDPDWDEDEEDTGDNILPVEACDDEDGDMPVVAGVEDMEDHDLLPISEIRKLDDTFENVAFVMNAGRLLAIKESTVVASMSKISAQKQDVLDVWQKPEYHALLRQEAKKHGLMASLKANGFRVERVNLTASKLAAKAVASETKRLQARLDKVQASNQERLEQSIAIAAVGISRNHFKGYENPLRAAIEEQVRAAGIKNPSRMMQRLFAAHGQGYIASVMSLANKLSAMPDEVRNSYADAMDMTSDEPDEVVPPVAKVSANEDEGYDFEHDEPSEMDDDVVGNDLTASLLRGPRRNEQSLTATRQKLSASALTQSVLRGEVNLFN